MRPSEESMRERRANRRRDEHRGRISDEPDLVGKAYHALRWAYSEIKRAVASNHEPEAREATRRVVDVAESLNRINR